MPSFYFMYFICGYSSARWLQNISPSFPEPSSFCRFCAGDPMLVLSPKNFNQRTGIVIGFPMTTAEYNDDNPFAVKFEGPKKMVSYILAHQPKSFDWRVCKAKIHPWEKTSKEILTTVVSYWIR